jgi:hypothetical protein
MRERLFLHESGGVDYFKQSEQESKLFYHRCERGVGRGFKPSLPDF